MKATPFEFRFRFWILIAVFVLGFAAPWNYALHLDGAGPNTHVWGQLAIELSRAGMNIAAAFRAVLIAGIALAIAGAALRTWATANPGPEVMRGETLYGGSTPISVQKADHLEEAGQEGNPPFAARRMGHPEPVVEGPYRYVRNPLYLGLWLNALALALLMPPSGAIFTLVLLLVFQLRLILAEEAWLSERLGEAYAKYCGKVPRIVPRMRSRSAPGGGSSSSVADERKLTSGAKAPSLSSSIYGTAEAVPLSKTNTEGVASASDDGGDGAIPTSLRDVGHPAAVRMGHPGGSARWGKAAVAEIFLWGTAVSFAALGWQYNAHLLIQCVLVSLGLALVAKGIAMGAS